MEHRLLWIFQNHDKVSEFLIYLYSRVGLVAQYFQLLGIVSTRIIRPPPSQRMYLVIDSFLARKTLMYCRFS